jgi:hypothetical protein
LVHQKLVLKGDHSFTAGPVALGCEVTKVCLPVEPGSKSVDLFLSGLPHVLELYNINKVVPSLDRDALDEIEEGLCLRQLASPAAV